MSSITTTINHGITLGTPGYYSPLTVTNTGAVNNNGTSAAIYGYAGTLHNAGTVSATGPGLDGVVFGGQFGTASIGNNGLVTATHSALYLAGYGTVTNTGTISSSGYDAIDIGSSGTVTNSTGTIIAAHWGIRTRGAGSVGNGGTIQASEAGIVVLGGGSVTNTGLISAPNGIEISGGAGSVVNAGSVNSNGANGVTLDAGGTVTNQANAVITSVGYTGVYIGGGAGELVNAGTINGALGVGFGATAGYTLIDSGTIVGAAGTAVSFRIGNDVLQFQPSTSVFIQGTVDGAGGTNTLEFTSGATTGTLTGKNASFTNFAIGTVDAGASWALAGNVTFGIGITLADNSALILAASGTLVNAGSITSELTGYSILGGGTAALLDNLGGIQAYNIGVSLRSGGTIINGASGNTTALISANYGAYAASGLISNYGTISASGTGSESVLLGGTGQVSNHVGGLITGYNIGIDLSGGVATLTNLGVVSAANNGALALYNGDVLMNGPGALIAGTRAVVMAAAATTPVSDTLKNYGTITGQYGVIAGVIPTTGTLHTTIVDAGTIIGTGGTAISALATSPSASVDLTLRLLVGNDFIQGAVVGEANSIGVLDFVSGSGAGTLTGSGADFINFQTASVDTGGNSTFAGTNTLGANTTLVDAGMLTNAGLLVVDPPITVTGTFVNAGTLSLTAGSYVVQLAPGGYFLNTTAGVVARPNGGGTYAPAIYGETGGTSRVVSLGTISNSHFDVGIRLNAGGTVTNGATNATSALIYGGFPVLILGASGTVNNYGTLRAVPTFGGLGVSLGAGGVVNNGIAGSTAALIAGDDYGVKLGGGGTVSNFGTITAPGTAGIGLLAGGLISNQAGGTISGGTEAITAAGTATIDNFGIIQSTSVFAAIAMASGTVINGSASNTTAAILGSTYGIEATGVAMVVNYGTVTANHQEGIGLRAGGSLDNLGVIDANEYGVFLYGPGTATNSGTITGLGGIVTNYDADVVVNSGDIAGTRGGGIILQAGGTVVDSGTISGSYVAVLFRGTVNNLLVLENGYNITGPIGGSASASSNAVELLGTSAANAVTASYNGLNLTRVGTIAFASSASNYATLRITNDATLPGTIAGFIGVHDTIDLTALSDAGNDATTSFDTLTNVLTMTGDNGTVMLQLANEDYAGVTWLAHNDGGGGTDVTPETGGSVSLTGTLANIGVPNEATSTPFLALTVTDPTEGDTDTVTITLSNPAFGTLSDLGGGGYDEATGVYTVSGMPSAVTTAIDQLVLTPASPAPNVYVTSTTLTVEAQGPVGAPATTSAIAASVQQILGLATVPSGQIAISVSADGTGFATAVNGDTNEAVVTVPTTGGTYVLPTGYQAEFLGGNGSATLQDFSVSDSVTVPSANPSLLVSNTGNDVLNGLTANDTIFASSGNDTLSEGVSAVLLTGDGNDSISAYNTLGTYLVTVGSGIDTIRIAGAGTVTGGTGTDLVDASASSSLASVQIASQGTHDTLLGGAGDATIASAGTDGLVLAGTGALSDDDTGHHDTIDAASASSAAVTTGGNAALVVGGSNTLNVQDQGFQDTVSAGGGATSVTTGGSQAQVLGGAGALSVLDGGLHDIIQAGTGPTSATLAGSDVIIKASTGSLSVLDQTANNTIIGGSGTSLFAVTIAAASAAVFGRAGPFHALDSASGALIGTGNGTASVTIAGSNAAVWGGSGTLALSIGGSNAVVGVGTDAATIDASDVGATNAMVFGGYSNTPSLDGAAVITGGANALLVATGGSSTTINAGSGSDSVYIGTGSIAGSNLINGSGPLLVAFVGGAGSATVLGGSGQTSLFGTAGTDALYQGSSTGALLYANGTNASSETLSAANSTSNDTLFSAHGNVSLVAGSGNDWLIAGDNTGSLGGTGSVVGGSTIVGGSGQDLFIFASSFSDGADVISNFTTSDTVYLSGYDTLAGGAADSDTQAMHALHDATMSGGNTTIALADGTSITFIDTTTAQLQGHLFST